MKGSSGANTTFRRKCITCREQIDVAATICPHCGSFQLPWKNHLRFFGGIVTVITLTTTAIAFMFDFISDGIQEVLWKDSIKVISFESYEFSLFQNVGDGPVYVERVEVVSKKGKEFHKWEIGMEVESGQVFKAQIGKRISTRLDTVLNGEKWSNLVSQRLENNAKYVKRYFGGDAATKLRRVLPNLMTFDCMGKIYFHSYKEKRRLPPQKFKCFGVLTVRELEKIPHLDENPINE